MHLLTITPNPAIDVGIEVPALEWGATLVASQTRRAAGGKGINMARVVVAMGGQATAVFLGGGPNGRFLHEELDMAGIEPVLVPVHGETRTNIVAHAPDGRSLKINAPGPAIRPEEAEALVGAVVEHLAGCTAVALGGSMPPGMPEPTIRHLLEIIRHKAMPLLADVQGPWLKLACEAGRPQLVKPNIQELEEAFGRPMNSRDAIIGAAHELLKLGARAVAITDGPRAAWLITTRGVYSAIPAPVQTRAMAGMGDAFGVGFLTARIDGLPDDQCFSMAMAYGAAVAASPETDLLTPDAVELSRRSIHVHRI